MKTYPLEKTGLGRIGLSANMMFLNQKKCSTIYIFEAKVMGARARSIWLAATEAEAEKYGLPKEKALYAIGAEEGDKERWREHQERVAKMWGPEPEKTKLTYAAFGHYRRYHKAMGKIEKMGRGGKAAAGSSELTTNEN
jgi:hypothetical protein